MRKNKIIVFLEKYYYIFLPLIISILSVMILNPWYDTGRDDISLANIVNSAHFNPHSEYTVFISVILGYIMRFFSLTFPSLNIYGITLLTSLSFAFSAFFYSTKKHGNKILSIPILCMLQVYMTFGITFTVVAFVCCAAAVLTIIDNVSRLDRKSIKYIILSFLLFFIGLSFRRGRLAIGAFLVLAPVCVFAVIRKKITIPVLLAIIVMFTGTNMFLKTTQNLYTQNLYAGTDYIEFNRYRGIITDTGDLNYDNHKEYFDSNGISENDVALFRSFLYNDKTILPTEKAKIVSKAFSFSDKYVLNPFYLAFLILKNPFILLFLILALSYFIAQKKDRKEIFITVFFVLGAVLYLYFRRRGVERVVKPIVFIGLMILLHIFQNRYEEFSKCGLKQKLIKVLPLCTIALFLGFSVITTPNTKVPDISEPLEYIKNDPEHKYVSFGGVSTENRLTFLRTPALSDNLMSGIYVGWTVYTPYWDSLLKLHGIDEYKDSLYLSLTDSRVKIISKSDESINMLVKALDEHYNKKLVVNKEKDFGNCFVCKLEETE